MDKKEIIEKLETKINSEGCSKFEPTVCDSCNTIFNWLYKAIKNSK